jgi:hypothetical protein
MRTADTDRIEQFGAGLWRSCPKPCGVSLFGKRGDAVHCGGACRQRAYRRRRRLRATS